MHPSIRTLIALIALLIVPPALAASVKSYKPAPNEMPPKLRNLWDCLHTPNFTLDSACFTRDFGANYRPFSSESAIALVLQYWDQKPLRERNEAENEVLLQLLYFDKAVIADRAVTGVKPSIPNMVEHWSRTQESKQTKTTRIDRLRDALNEVEPLRRQTFEETKRVLGRSNATPTSGTNGNRRMAQ